jgi:hypothetical protein
VKKAFLLSFILFFLRPEKDIPLMDRTDIIKNTSSELSAG